MTTSRHRWYRGDCHVHSSRSVGADLTPAQLVAAARAARLDFIATTEHNTIDGHGDWHPSMVGDLLVILGQEVVTARGHWLALGIDAGQLVGWQYPAAGGGIAEQLARVRGSGGVAVVAHPHAPYPGGKFEHPLDGFDLVEVWNGAWSSNVDWQADNETALAHWSRSLTAVFDKDAVRPTAGGGHGGQWRPAIGNSDAHLAGQLGTPHTVVRADERSVSAILAGLRAGHSWIAGGATIDLTVTASVHHREAGIGEHLESAGEPITVEVTVSGVPAGALSIHTDHGRAHRETLPNRQTAAVQWRTDARESAFVRIELRHADGRMAALSNPIIIA